MPMNRSRLSPENPVGTRFTVSVKAFPPSQMKLGTEWNPSLPGSRIVAGAVLIGIALLVSSCREPSVTSPDIVARVGDADITKQSLQAELERRARNGQSVAAAGGPAAVLDDLIRLETLFANAKAAGYDHDPELAQQFKRLVAAKFEDDQRKKGPVPRKPEPGEISPVVRAPDGFYLLKLIERLPAETAPLEQVRDRIERQLLAAEQKRAREQFDAIQRQGLKIEINQPLLQSLEAPTALAKTEGLKPLEMLAP